MSDTLPTPFTAEQIREACGTGKTIRLRVELPDGTSFDSANRFRELDAEGATLDRWRADAPDEVTSRRVTWVELQGHAAFPADRTTVTTEVLDLPLGRLECTRYDTRDEPDADVESYWFSPAHPGMPVRYEAGSTRTTVLSIHLD